jgi:hypothetical protein
MTASLLSLRDAPDGRLTLGQFTLTRTSLDVRGTASIDEWLAMGGMLRTVHGASKWLLGDWLNYGERTYGEKYAQALEATDLDYQGLADIAWTCRHIDPSRRREGVRFSVHREVAALPADQQNAILEHAAVEGLTVADVRAEVWRAKHPNAEPPRSFVVRNVPPELAAALEKKAAQEDIGVGDAIIRAISVWVDTE